MFASADLNNRDIAHATVQELSAFALTYGPAFLVLILPALVNGFPLMFDDSGTYLRAAIEHHVPVDRPVYYSLFLLPLHWRLTLWPIVAVQAGLAVAVLAIFLRRTLALPRPDLALLLVLVCFVTGLPGLASQIMPDLFTPLMVLSLVALVLPWNLTKPERWFLFSVVLAGVLFHQTNYVIAIATLGAGWAVDALSRRRLAPPRALLKPALTVALGIALLILPNIFAHRAFAVTRGGAVFLLAKVIDDGPGLDYLAQACPSVHYSICGQLADISRYRAAAGEAGPRNSVADYILWQGPLTRAGGWVGVIPYAGEASLAAIRQEPGAFLMASWRGFASQLVHFGTGDGLGHIPETGLLNDTLQRYFPPGVQSAFAHSLEQQNRLHFSGLSRVDEIMAAAGFVLLLALLITGATRSDAAAAVMFMTAVLANAFVTGAFSTVHDRYQSRVVCLIVIAALVMSYRRLAGQAGKAADT